LLAAAIVAGSGSLLAARGLFVALRRHAILMRSVVALWAVTFYVAALLALVYVVSLFLHCPPN
jgi:predicted membrane channel-forming protein YqfA (hemolysin III family)